MRLPYWTLRLWGRFGPRRNLHIVNSDTPPETLETRDLYLAREDGEDWAVAMRCPCGCGDQLELLLIEEASPHWMLKNTSTNFPTLHPSVWRKTGCKSHFWVRNGRIIWC